MAIASFEAYSKMLDKAQNENFAFPAINITSIATANAVMRAFADKNSDGIIQVSTGGGQFASGLGVKNAALGAIALAEYIHRMADQYPVNFALHTDHCTADKVDSFLMPLLEETKKRRKEGKSNLFQSHMFDGSTCPIKENMEISQKLMEICTENEIILEVEIGVVGGEEDGVNNEGVPSEKLYTSPEDMMYVHECLAKYNHRFMVAATFGNVHGVYKPGNVKLKPKILKEGQQAVVDKYGQDAYLDLVFHGGSGSSIEEIHETLGYGVIKMNVDTDMQYAFTRPIAEHMFQNYDGVLKVDSGVGNKKVYDPRSYLKKAEESMYQKTLEVIDILKSTDKSVS